MTNNITTPKPILTIREGVTFANSRNVAECFNKRHDNVLRDIVKIVRSTPSDLRWFVLTSYTDAKGESRDEYEMTREGFDILVMGWTGRKAASFKEAYIAAFNAMVSELRTQQL